MPCLFQVMAKVEALHQRLQKRLNLAEQQPAIQRHHYQLRFEAVSTHFIGRMYASPWKSCC